MLTPSFSGDKIGKNEMGGECSAYGENLACSGFGGETNHLGDPEVGGRIILQWIFSEWDVRCGLDRGDFRDRWCALVNAVRNVRIP